MSVGLVLLLVVGLVVAVLLYGTFAKTRWGINFAGATCPKCGLAMPRVRTPTDAEEAKWGGWTCSQCGTRSDKWGRARP
jgi:hypothetical protein